MATGQAPKTKEQKMINVTVHGPHIADAKHLSTGSYVVEFGSDSGSVSLFFYTLDGLREAAATLAEFAQEMEATTKGVDF